MDTKGVLRAATFQLAQEDDLAVNLLYRYVVVFDAAEGMNRPFSETVAKLHEKNIKPILVIINSDPVNVGDAEMSAAEIVAEIDPEAQPWDLNFKTLFFSADKGFANTPAFERRGMDALIEAIQ